MTAQNDSKDGVSVTGRTPADPELQDLRWGRQPSLQRSTKPLLKMDFRAIEARVLAGTLSSPPHA